MSEDIPVRDPAGQALVQAPSPDGLGPTGFDPSRVAEVLADGDGFWRTCSGCYETEDGYDVGHYPHSDLFGCKMGGGCGDCGGLGIVWDNIDYDEMAREMLRDDSEVGRLRAVLAKYADDLCEGWCDQSWDCANFEDCGGCLAARTARMIAAPKAPEPCPVIVATDAVLECLHQYASDLRYPPSGDSIQRRIERVEAIIAIHTVTTA